MITADEIVTAGSRKYGKTNHKSLREIRKME